MNNSVLVTGGSGFIGTATVRALLSAGWNVTVGSKSKAKALGMAGRLVYLDLRAPHSILALADVERFDVIIHLGAQVDFRESCLGDLFVPNALSTGVLASLARIWGARMIFASTVAVHGLNTDLVDVTSPIVTDNAYANTKWLAEQMIAASGASYCILRIGGVFGLRGPNHLGLNKAIDGALRGIVPVQVGSGAALRNYIYVEDVAAAIAHVLANDVRGTHMLAGHEVISIHQLLCAVCDQFLPGMRPKVVSGIEAKNQILKTSRDLPISRSFQQALIDLKAKLSNETCIIG
ncbi:MAG: NAD(P)-dependent oxidoreductase [Pseudomonadota bacterium]